MLYLLYILIILIITITALGVWIKGGGQKAENSIPEVLEGPEFKTYKAVTPESPLRLKHFISQSNEINVSSSLVMGHKEIIVFTAQATKYAAERLADEIEKTGLKLTYVYLDHAHLDHSQGASVLIKRFPDAKFVGAPRVVALQKLRIKADDKMALKRYGENAAIPSVPFEALDSNTLMIEGREIQLTHNQYGDVGIGYEDEPHTIAYIPDLKALLPTDICYFGAHMMMGGTTPKSRAKWKEQLRSYLKMDVEVVIPGHIPRTWSDKLTPKTTIEYSLKYIEDYENALESSKSSDEVIAKMLELYPEQEHTSALYIGTLINFGETHRLLFNPRLEKVMSFLPKSFVKWFDKNMFESKKKAANLL
ncbi:MBL fold metallo-hydrolase [Aquimarina algicola]|uniref:MBL fold metallo-hydrolase n=1 Tax=Aquimarina algicola TaxID=2589995 RepID=A0A504J813_9FLAO|nr:MBL fold metallo-hydrolase [Aquimarina algicola]TPN87016.1 MBL fold metallo-hydrolase [Aquimarina algicola]